MPVGSRLGPIPTREQFARLAAYLAQHSGNWMGARLLMFVATVSMCRLSIPEAVGLEFTDLDDGSGRLVVTHRSKDSRRREGRSLTYPVVGEVLRALIELWRPRASARWIFPNQSRTNRWAHRGGVVRSRHDGSKPKREYTPMVQLANACEAAGLPIFTFAGLKEFGALDPCFLSDAEDSPFRIRPDDSATMQPKDMPIDDLQSIILEDYFMFSNRNILTNYRRVFAMIRQDPEVCTARDLLRPDFLPRFASTAGLAFPFAIRSEGMGTIYQLRSIFSHCLRLGCFDSDPFAALPGFRTRGQIRADKPVLKRSTRHVVRKPPSLVVFYKSRPSRNHYDPWEKHYWVNGVRKSTPLGEDAYRVTKALLDAGDEGMTGAMLTATLMMGTRWRRILAKLSEDPDWAAVIRFPGNGSRYRLGLPIKSDISIA